MKTVYYLYKDHKPINSNALSENDVNEIKKHNNYVLILLYFQINVKKISDQKKQTVKYIIIFKYQKM